MVIGGLQKLSLSDFPGRIAAVVFTQGCNLRCAYCHNPSLVVPALYASTIAEDEVFRFLENRRGRLTGVVLSGGEPCVQTGLPRFVTLIRGMGFDVKLDTNGTEPSVLRSLVSAGLVNYVALDLKAPAGDYPRIAGADVDPEDVAASLSFLKSSGIPFEVRTTWAPALFSAAEFARMAPLLRGVPRFFLQPVRLPSDEGGDPAAPAVSREAIGEAVGVLTRLGIAVTVR